MWDQTSPLQSILTRDDASQTWEFLRRSYINETEKSLACWGAAENEGVFFVCFCCLCLFIFRVPFPLTVVLQQFGFSTEYLVSFCRYYIYIYIYLIFQKAKKTFTIMIQTAIVKKCSNQFSLVVSRVFSLPGIISLKIRCGTWSPQWPASDALSDFTKIECMTCLFNTLPMLYMYTKKYVYVLLHYISAMHQMCVCV